MGDVSIIKLLQNREQSAIIELRQKYERLCTYITGNVLSQYEDIEESVNSACYELWNSIPHAQPNDLKSFFPYRQKRRNKQARIQLCCKT